MSELVTLPMQMTSGKGATFLAPLLLVSGFVGAGALYYVFGQENMRVSPQLRVLIPVGLIMAEIVTTIFLVIAMKPRHVEIRADGISTTPLPVLGISIGVPEQCAISDFKSLDIAKQKGGKGGTIYTLTLRGVAGVKDLSLDIPQKTDKHQFAAQLGAALNLKVNDDA